MMLARINLPSWFIDKLVIFEILYKVSVIREQNSSTGIPGQSQNMRIIGSHF